MAHSGPNASTPSSPRSNRAQALSCGLVALTVRMKPGGSPCSVSRRANASNGLRRDDTAEVKHHCPYGHPLLLRSGPSMTSGHVHVLDQEADGVRLLRMTTSRVEGPRSILDMHYLVASPSGSNISLKPIG